MRLDSSSLVEIRELASNKELSRIEHLSFSGYTIGAVVELACLRAAVDGPLRSLFDRWAESSTLLAGAFRTLETGNLNSSSPNLWAARKVDFFSLRGTNWFEDRTYHPFESRFQKAAKAAGFGNRAEGLTGAMFEMADNVAQHSGSCSAAPSPGLIGYFAHNGHVAFAIGDSGRGILASLKENPMWAHLSSSTDALEAVVKNHASRRQNMGEGEGFKQMFRSLADLNGYVVLSSHNGRMRLHQNLKGRQALVEFVEWSPGVQLSVSCSLNGAPREQEIAVDNLT